MNRGRMSDPFRADRIPATALSMSTRRLGSERPSSRNEVKGAWSPRRTPSSIRAIARADSPGFWSATPWTAMTAMVGGGEVGVDTEFASDTRLGP